MNQRIEYDIATKCGKIRHNCSFLRDKIIIFIQIRSSKVARNCEAVQRRQHGFKRLKKVSLVPGLDLLKKL